MLPYKGIGNTYPMYLEGGESWPGLLHCNGIPSFFTTFPTRGFFHAAALRVTSLNHNYFWWKTFYSPSFFAFMERKQHIMKVECWILSSCKPCKHLSHMHASFAEVQKHITRCLRVCDELQGMQPFMFNVFSIAWYPHAWVSHVSH